MKKIIGLLFLFVLTSSFTSSQVTKGFDIVGKWTGVDGNNEEGSFIFDEFGYAVMIKDGERTGGKEFDIDGEKGSMTYQLDESTSPIKFDVTVTILKTAQKMSMLCLMKIVDNNTIILASDFNNTRPTSFTKDNSITLKRQ